MTSIDWILLSLTLLIAAPIAVIVLETLAALFSSKGRISPWSDLQYAQDQSSRPAAAILIPAHNEEKHIGFTIASIRPQMAAGDRLLVIADNCTDDTTRIARNAWAQVIERQHETERGKGFALAAGVAELSASAPAIVIIIDADTIVSPGSLDALIRRAASTGNAQQANYLLAAPDEASPKAQISSLAFAFKNHVRALGADALAIPCMLRGTGMAFPWATLCDAKLATGNIVEDMQLGLDLAIHGHSPQFCAGARVTGHLPDSHSAATTQRTRWEHGHLQTILHNVPYLLGQAIKQRRPALVLLAVDLAVPPLALLVTSWILLVLAATLARYAHLAGNTPLFFLFGCGATLFASIVAGWARFARHLLPFASFVSIPVYILWKIPLYFAFFIKRQKHWVRTERA